MVKKTVSLYVQESKWNMAKELGFNMSEEVDKLMDLLISTSLTDDGEAEAVISRRHKLEKELRLMEQRKEEKTAEYTRVIEQENKYKLKLAQIEENKQYSRLLREFNKIIVRNEYSLKGILSDRETAGMIEQLEEYETDWTESKILQQINRVRKFMEGF